VLSRVFLIQEDYKTIREDQTLLEFQDLRKEIGLLPATEQAKKTKQVDDFLRHALQGNKKMFGMRWLHPDNVFLACFGERETSRIVCQRILNLPFCANPRKTLYNAILESGNPQTAMMVSISVMMRALPLLCLISREDTYTP
jgi:hypothetical protein